MMRARAGWGRRLLPQWQWRQVLRLARWYSVLVPLLAAVAAGVVTLASMGSGGNQWCNANGFSCSVDTNMLGVVVIGGLTSYWFYGVRRAVLLGRLRRSVVARAGHSWDAGVEAPVRHEAHDPVISAVLGRHQGWRRQPPVTVVTGAPGSGKSAFLGEVVRRLARPGNWYVPVPLEDVAGGGVHDILDAAQRELQVILHDASINPGLMEALSRSLMRRAAAGGHRRSRSDRPGADVV